MTLIKRLREEVLHLDREEMFSVSREGVTGRYFLDVLCGGVGMFERRLEMNPEEIGWFLHDHQQMKTLVRQVRAWPDRFEGRLGPASA